MEYLSTAASLAVIWGTMLALFLYVIVDFYFDKRAMKNRSVTALLGADDDVISARKRFKWYRLALSLFATLLAPWVFFAPPEVGATVSWWGIIGYGASSVIPYLLLAILGPMIWERGPSDSLTFTDYAKCRFGRPTQVILLLAGLFNLFVGLVANYTAIGSTWSFLCPTLQPVWAVTPVCIITTAYVFLGGLKATITTDGIQGVAVLVLLLACTIHAIMRVEVTAEDYQAASVWTKDGLRTFIVLVASVLPAGLLESTSWQRIGAAETFTHARLGFISASALVAPVIILLGFTGLYASAAYPARVGENPSIAFFVLLEDASVRWKVLIGILTILAVSSSVDSSQMGVVSFVTREVGLAGWSLGWGMAFGAALNIPAAILGVHGFSIFELFLIGNLVTSAVVTPLFMGLWSRTNGVGTFCGCVCGLLSIVVVGWVYTGTFVGGLTWMTLPEGYDTNSAIVTYLVVPGISLVATIFASLLAGRRELAIVNPGVRTGEDKGD